MIYLLITMFGSWVVYTWTFIWNISKTPSSVPNNSMNNYLGSLSKSCLIRRYIIIFIPLRPLNWFLSIWNTFLPTWKHSDLCISKSISKRYTRMSWIVYSSSDSSPPSCMSFVRRWVQQIYVSIIFVSYKSHLQGLESTWAHHEGLWELFEKSIGNRKSTGVGWVLGFDV